MNIWMASIILNERYSHHWDASCKFIKNPHKRLNYDPNSVDGWYLGPAVHYYRYYTCYNIDIGGEIVPYTIAFFPAFMRIPNYCSIDMAIHAAAYLEKALQTHRPESPFQVRDAQLKAIRELAKLFNSDTKIPNMDALPTPPDLLMKKSTKLPRVEDHIAPSPRVDPDRESKNREQKLPSPIQTTPPSEATRKKYIKNSRN